MNSRAVCAVLAGAMAAHLCTSSPLYAQQPPRGGKMVIPVQKSGKVVMQDGSPLPEPVDVVALCGGGVALPIAKTDSKGGFVVGSGRAGESDARMQRNAAGPGGALSGNAQLAGCALQARLAGYESSTLRVVDNESFDVGTIILSRRTGVEGTTFSATALKAPKDAQKAYDKAKQAMAKNKPDQAKPLLEKVVQAYPEHAAAWTDLGRVYQVSKDLPNARKAYEQAIKADPKFVTPYLHLAMVYNAEKNWQATADTTATVIKLDPVDYPAAYALNAMSNMRLNKDREAEASAKKALEIGNAAAFPEMEYILGVILSARGDNKGAAEHLNNFLKVAPNSPAAEAVKKQIAELEKK